FYILSKNTRKSSCPDVFFCRPLHLFGYFSVLYVKVNLSMARTTQIIFEILEAEKENLFQYASYRLHNISDVEDVLQNLYVKILENPRQFMGVANKRAYIYRTICNECNKKYNLL
ncbi:MAG: hypothetical protein K2F91_09920, partial [Muribaculaceae bacterium]|nr:hypothetical protein [Muribaculaceae bacterium]